MNTDWTQFLADDDHTESIVDSDILRSQIDYCSVYHSTIADSHLYFDPDYRLDPSIPLDDPNYPIYSSSIVKSEVTNSIIVNSTVVDSFIEECTIRDSTITNSVIQDSTVVDSVINNQKIVGKKRKLSEDKTEGNKVKDASKRLKKTVIQKGEKKEKKSVPSIGALKRIQMGLSTEFIQKDTSSIELSKLLNIDDILSADDREISVYTEKGESTIGKTISNARCILLINGTYAFHSIDLFAPITFYTANISRYTNKLPLNSQYFVFRKTSVRYLSVEGAVSIIHHFRGNSKYTQDKLRYLDILEMCLYKMSEALCQKTYDSPIEYVKEKRTKQRGWDDYFDELSDYISRNRQKRLYFPPGTVEYSYLLNWCTNQKYHRKRGILTEDKLKRLDSLKGFHWGSYTDPNSPHSKRKWDDMFSRLKTYLASINHQPLYFERGDTENKKLVKWCQSQKTSIKRKRITERRYNMLCSLPGFHFGTYTLKDNQFIATEDIKYPTRA